MIPEFCISLGCPDLFFLLPIISVGVVLIFQVMELKPHFLWFHGTGSGTSVLVPRFWRLGAGSYFWIPGFQH